MCMLRPGKACPELRWLTGKVPRDFLRPYRRPFWIMLSGHRKVLKSPKRMCSATFASYKIIAKRVWFVFCYIHKCSFMYSPHLCMTCSMPTLWSLSWIISRGYRMSRNWFLYWNSRIIWTAILNMALVDYTQPNQISQDGSQAVAFLVFSLLPLLPCWHTVVMSKSHQFAEVIVTVIQISLKFVL